MSIVPTLIFIAIFLTLMQRIDAYLHLRGDVSAQEQKRNLSWKIQNENKHAQKTPIGTPTGNKRNKKSDTDTDTCMCITTPCNCGVKNTKKSKHKSGKLLNEKLLVECPVIGPAISCTLEYNPIICGKVLDCHYNNECTAAGAGWNVLKQCTPDTYQCPTPNSDTICVEIHKTVSCGSHKCIYSNTCFATASGWRDDDCKDVDDEYHGSQNNNTISFGPASIVSASMCKCPKDQLNCRCDDLCPPSDPSIRCMSSPNAYQCGGYQCHYGSKCLAGTADWDIDMDCIPATDPALETSSKTELDVYQNDDNGCPITDPTWMCVSTFDPVQCQQNATTTLCDYSNDCMAQGAGWNVGMQCMLAVTETHSNPKNCPTPSNKAFCTFEYQPVTCHRGVFEGCEYGNACIAKAAGFNAKQHCHATLI
jgi:hypothetical protein